MWQAQTAFYPAPLELVEPTGGSEDCATPPLGRATQNTADSPTNTIVTLKLDFAAQKKGGRPSRPF